MHYSSHFQYRLSADECLKSYSAAVICALQSLKSLAAAASLDKLQHLDLCHNDLGGAAAAEGLQQLVAGAGQLQSLKLRNTAIKGTGRPLRGAG